MLSAALASPPPGRQGGRAGTPSLPGADRVGCTDRLGDRIVEPPRRSPAIEMLDRGLVAPGDPLPAQAEGPSDAVALLRAGRPPAQHDRLDPLLVHARALGQFTDIDPALGAKSLDARDCVRHHRSPPPGRRLT